MANQEHPGLVAIRSLMATGTTLPPTQAKPEAWKTSTSLHDVGVSALDNSTYDVDAMNEEFALVMIGKDAVVVWFRPGASESEGLRFLSIKGFGTLSANALHRYEDENGKKRSISFAAKWLQDPKRRQYAGIEFWPDAEGKPGKPGFLNIFRGFAMLPSSEGSYSIFADHLLTNVCHGDREMYAWLFAWFASIFQAPRAKPGTAIVLRGGMGAGKTIVGQAFGSLLGTHYVLADDARYLTGQFNAHQASCLLLQVDEGFWAGDKGAEGRLKGLVTSTTQLIEHKGVDPITVDNHLRLMISSNHDWIVPAGKDERRFAVFDVGQHCAQNHQYFAELIEELDAGGRERLLYDLLGVDLSKVNLRQIPKTAALLEQKVHSLDPIEAWLLDRLQAGAPTKGLDHWPAFVPSRDLFSDYVTATERIGIHRKAAEVQFGIKLRKLMPMLRRARHAVPIDDGPTVERLWGYELPTLDDARAEFERSVGQSMEWDVVDA